MSNDGKVKLLRAIKAKEIMGVIGKDNEAKQQWLKLAKDGDKLFNLAGDINSYGSKHTSLGEAYFLLGMFLARNNLTGQLFKSNKVWLPSKSDAENLIAEFKTVRESDKSGVLGFSIEYTVEESAASPTGYTFISEHERSPEQVTREAELLGRMKALPAPKAAKKAA